MKWGLILFTRRVEKVPLNALFSARGGFLFLNVINITIIFYKEAIKPLLCGVSQIILCTGSICKQ